MLLALVAGWYVLRSSLPAGRRGGHDYITAR